MLTRNIIVTRDSEVIMFSPCVFVCVCVCVSVNVCRDVCPDDLTMKDWCNTNNILQVHFENRISPSIFELQRRSKAQNIGNANGYLSGVFNFQYHSGKKFVASSKWRPFLKFWNITHSFNLTSFMKRSSQIMPKRYFLMMMTSSITSQGGPQSRRSVFLYKWNNDIFHDN